MRILIADVQAKVRFALRVLLERQPSCEIVGEASTGDDLIAQVQASCPDLMLLGWELPHPSRGEGRPLPARVSSCRDLVRPMGCGDEK